MSDLFVPSAVVGAASLQKGIVGYNFNNEK